MENTNKEYKRVLDNPSNLIISEDLEGVLDIFDQTDGEEDLYNNQKFVGAPKKITGTVHINEQDHICEVLKIQKLKRGVFKIKCYVPTFPVAEFIRESKLSFSFDDQKFSIEDESAVTFQSNGILTFTSRRIINNEEV